MTLTEIWKFVSENALISTLAAAVVVAVAGWLAKVYRDRRDSKIIYLFLCGSVAKTDWDFRATAAIASATKLSEERVATLCSKHPRIRRNAKELESWRLDS